jgi:hypothetical protein
MLSGDTFVLPPEQPRNLKADCTLVIHERSGALLTVRDTRLFPAEAAGALPVADASKSACLKCGTVQGVIEDRVSFRDHDGGSCGMVEPSKTPTVITVPVPTPLMNYRKNLDARFQNAEKGVARVPFDLQAT